MTSGSSRDGSVLALYTGQSRPARIDGRCEPTAYSRTPAGPSLCLGSTGFAGSELATARRLGNENHAVYLLLADHYRYFESVLGRCLEPGAFAENVLYDGPDEARLRMGDRLRIGDAVIELTTPRVPCYKMAHFLGADPGFPSRFSASGRTGVYARIVTPGAVAVGDQIRVVESDARNATIRTLNGVLTGARPGPELIAEVEQSPAMFPGLLAVIRDRLAILNLDDGAKARMVTITERTRETPDIVSLGFEMKLHPGEAPRPGQFVTLGIEDDRGRQHFRCYSLTGGSRTRSGEYRLRIAVKRDAESTSEPSVSCWIHERVRPGAECIVYPPAGEFVLPREISGPLAFIAGGIGITPILAQLRSLAGMRYAAPVSLIYVAKTADDLAFREAISACGQKLERFDLRLFLTGQSAGAAGPAQRLRPGRPDLQAEIAALDRESHLFVCGPPSMIEQARSAHAALGRANDRLHFELFTAAPSAAEQAESASEAEILIASRNFRGTWKRSDGPLLSWLEEKTGCRPPAACRSGICRTCRASLLSGRVVYPASVAPPGPAEVLLCCAMPQTDIEIELPNT